MASANATFAALCKRAEAQEARLATLTQRYTELVQAGPVSSSATASASGSVVAVNSPSDVGSADAKFKVDNGLQCASIKLAAGAAALFQDTAYRAVHALQLLTQAQVWIDDTSGATVFIRAKDVVSGKAAVFLAKAIAEGEHALFPVALTGASSMQQAVEAAEKAVGSGVTVRVVKTPSGSYSAVLQGSKADTAAAVARLNGAAPASAASSSPLSPKVAAYSASVEQRLKEIHALLTKDAAQRKQLTRSNAALEKANAKLQTKATNLEKSIAGKAKGKAKAKGKGKEQKKQNKQGKQAKKQKGGKKGGDKAGPTPEELAKLKAKKLKAVIKEGGKKGQDIAGIATFGQLFATCDMAEPKADLELLKQSLAGANKVPDPDADDLKGGAGEYGKFFFSSTDDKVAMICHVPKALASSLSAEEWVNHTLKAVGLSGDYIVDKTDEVISIFAANDGEKGIFALKIKDAAIFAAYGILETRKLVPEDDGEEVDLSELNEQAGVAWNTVEY